MIDCGSIQSKFSEYLDGRLTGHEMQFIAAHIDDCQGCSVEWAGLKKTQVALASLGPVPGARAQPQESAPTVQARVG
jgi:anti-sigma factor RsiW